MKRSVAWLAAAALVLVVALFGTGQGLPDALSDAATQAFIEEALTPIKQNAAIRALEQVKEIIKNDPVLLARALASPKGDWTVVNEVLSKLEINLDVGALAEKPLIVYNAKCLAIIGLEICVTLWFFFPDPNAVCKNIAIRDDVKVDGALGSRSVFWGDKRTEDPAVPDECQITSDQPCEEDLCGVVEDERTIDDTFIVTELASDNTRGCSGRTFNSTIDRLLEEYVWQLSATEVYLECVLPVQARTSAQSLSLGIRNPVIEGDEDALGSLFVNGTIDVNLKQLAVSANKFNARSPIYSKPIPDGCTPDIFNQSAVVSCDFNQTCNPYVDADGDDCLGSILTFTELYFEFFDLDPVVIDLPLGLPQITVQELTPDVNVEINGKQKSVAQEPIEDVLRDVLNSANEEVGKLLTNFSDSENGTYDLKPARSVRVVREEALKPQQALNPVPGQNLLVDVGNNLVVDTLGLFPEGSIYISGDDPNGESPLEALYGFLTDEEVVVDEDADPVLGIIDTYLGTELASKPRGSSHNIDLIAAATVLLGEEEVVPGVGYTLNFGFSVVEEKGEAINVTIVIPEATLTITPRADAYQEERLNYLDRLYLTGPQTLIIPPVEGFDLTLDVNVDFDLIFYGGETLIEGSKSDYETGTAEAILAEIIPFTDAENFRIQLTWLNFFIEAAALLAVDEIAVRNLEVGPLANNLFDCLWSTWFETPQLASLALNSGGVTILVSDRTTVSTSGIFYLLQVAVNEISPMFAGIVPKLLTDVAQENLVGEAFLDDTVCPKAVEKPNEFFSFVGPFMDDIRELASEDNVVALIGGLFPKGDTPESKDWNQVITEPLTIFELEGLPSENGLPVTLEFKIAKFELQGVEPANFTNFTFLNVNASSEEYPYGLYTELGVGIPTNPFRFGLEVEINVLPENIFRRELDEEDKWDEELFAWEGEETAFSGRRNLQFGSPSIAPTSYPTFLETARPSFAPTLPVPSTSPTVSPTLRPTGTPTKQPTPPLPRGAQINKVRIEASFENIFAKLDLLFKFYDYDIISTKLEDVLKFWCWLGKLQFPGGVKDVALNLISGDLDFTCKPCSNPIMYELQELFTNDAADEEFFKFINEEILDSLAQILVNFFEPENWERSITDIQRWCEGLETLVVDESFDSLKEDLTGTYAFLGAATLALSGLACINCACLSSTHKDDKHHEKPLKGSGGGKVKDVGSFLEEVDALDHVAYELEHTPLFQHPAVPACWRVLIPALFVLNLGLFLIGHVGQAVTTSLYAGVAGVPIELEDFQSISVIQSAEAVWNSGGYFLAILIVGLSIMWPYIKILGMCVAWFAPTRVIGFHARGTLIKRLDQLGKWSLIELFLLLFILVTFRLKISSPQANFLPKGFYYLELGITPQLSIYTFCTALVISLATSNVIEWWHEAVEKKLAVVNRRPQAADEVPISIIEYKFPTVAGRHSLGITNLGSALVVIFAIVAIAGKIVAAFTPVLGTEVLGLASLVIEAEGVNTKQYYSLARFFLIIFGSGDVGEIYLGVFFALTVIVIPVMQLMLLLKLLLGRFTLDKAIFWYDVNVIFSAWACSEVFIMGVGFTVMELGQISGNLVKRECAFLQPIMQNQLEPLGYVDAIDVQASCYTLIGTIEGGLYILFVAMIFANLVHYFVTVSFLKFIQARLELRSGERPVGKATTGLERCLLSGGCMAKAPAQSNMQIAV